MFVRSTRSIDRAFTISELLVVIAITTLLIAMLLPTLDESRAEARRVLCMGNQKQVGEYAAAWSLNNGGQLPSFTGILELAHVDVCACPDDIPAAIVPHDVFGLSEDKATSYEINREYHALKVTFDQIPNAATKIYTYDGDLGSTIQNVIVDGVVTVRRVVGSVSVDGSRATFIHIPPGNPASAYEMTTGLSALQAHIGHGDFIGTWPAGVTDFSFVNYAQGKFKRRHGYNDSLGNVLYLDGHVESRPSLTADMFLYPDGNLVRAGGDGTGTTGGTTGGTGNGVGNGNGSGTTGGATGGTGNGNGNGNGS